jgi:formate-dependent phosphoribosylglycinamide formyltransferase (GAR transformylase)
LKKSDYTVDAITPEGEAVTKQVGNKTFTYYVASPSAVSSSSVVSAPAISKTVTIKIKGKGNYKDEFTVTGQTVNIQPQRINPGTISGGVVTFGSIGNAMDGLTLDDGTEATKDNVKFKAKTKKISKWIKTAM